MRKSWHRGVYKHGQDPMRGVSYKSQDISAIIRSAKKGSAYSIITRPRAESYLEQLISRLSDQSYGPYKLLVHFYGDEMARRIARSRKIQRPTDIPPHLFNTTTSEKRGRSDSTNSQDEPVAGSSSAAAARPPRVRRKTRS